MLFLGGELFQLVGPGEDAGVLTYGAAGHGAAGVHHLAVQGDDLEAAAVFLGHGNGSIHVLDNDGAAQQIVHDGPVGLFAVNQLRGHAHEAPAAFQAALLQNPPLNAGKGQEGGSSSAGAFQKADGRLAVGLISHHDLLHGSAQGDFDGHGVAVLGADESGHRAVNAMKSAPFRLLHHHADGFLVIFKVPLHGPEHPGFGGDGIQIRGQLPQLLGGVLHALCPGGLTQGVARDGIVRGGDLLLGLLQLLLSLLQLGLGTAAAGGPGGQVGVQLLQPLGALGDAVLQAPDIRFPARNIGGQGGFLTPQLQKPLGHALGAGGHGGKTLLQFPQLGGLLGDQCVRLLNPGLGLLDLAADAPGAILLAL